MASEFAGYQWRREGYAVALNARHDRVPRNPIVTDRRPTLVVEDAEHVRRALTRFLCSRGYGVRAIEHALATSDDAHLAGDTS